MIKCNEFSKEYQFDDFAISADPNWNGDVVQNSNFQKADDGIYQILMNNQILFKILRQFYLFQISFSVPRRNATENP